MSVQPSPRPLLGAIGTALPPHRLTQADAAAYFGAAAGLQPRQVDRLARALAQTGIDTRHSVLAEFTDPHQAPAGIGQASTAARSALYRHYAPPLAEEACRRALAQASLPPAQVTHLITISCTGMYAPGLDFDLALALDLPRDTERTSINFMGCYAAMQGLKQAAYILRADPSAQVLMVAVELSSLHMQASLQGDALAGNALFADGAAAAVLSTQPTPGRPALALDRFLSRTAPNTAADMAWTIGDHGFDIQLSSYVPSLLQDGIAPLISDLRQRAGRANGAHPTLWAIHPGGIKILQACEAALGLAEADLAHSYAVLRDCGNMSSATILFVLDRVLRQANLSPQAEVVACAFGPGLTMESLIGQLVA